jgi:hypothetical protein
LDISVQGKFFLCREKYFLCRESLFCAGKVFSVQGKVFSVQGKVFSVRGKALPVQGKVLSCTNEHYPDRITFILAGKKEIFPGRKPPGRAGCRFFKKTKR